MRLKVDRYAMYIYPEDDIDVAYIEDTLGLREAGASIALARDNAIGLSCVSQLVTQRETVAKSERAAIVGWLRTRCRVSPTAAQMIADEIERGVHRSDSPSESGKDEKR